MAEAALVASAALQVVGGIQANKQAKKEARIAEAESEERAQSRIRDTRRARSRQLVGFLKSGVRLQGSPFDILDETVELGAQDVRAIRQTGAAQARQFRNVGRQRLIGGIGGGVGSLSKTSTAQKLENEFF